MFGKTGSIARIVSLTILITLFGSLQVPAASATTPAPEDGFYDCATGEKRDDTEWRGFRISGGNVYNINCTGEVVLPEGLPAIRNFAFAQSQLTSIIIPSSVTSIGGYAFYQSNLESIIIPSGVTSIGGNAFAYARSLTSITIPEGVTSIGARAFQSASALTSITIPEGVTSVAEYTFSDAAALESVTLPSSITSIGEAAFFGTTALTSIEIPSGVTSLGALAFFGSTSLTSITLPSSVASIGEMAFAEMDALAAFSVASGSANYSAIDGVLLDETATSLILYPGARPGSSYVIPDSVTSIGAYAFVYSELTSVTMPAGLTIIGNNAFEGAAALTSIVIPEGVTSMGEKTFKDATALTSVTIPSTVTSIGYSVFQGATALTSVTIPSSVTSIGAYAFAYATALKSISIPASVTEIGPGAFAAASSLTSIVIPQGVTSIGEETFGFATALTSVTIPSSVTEIGAGAFYAATSLTSIVIPQGVTSIQEATFQEASALTSVTIPASVTRISENAFSAATSLNAVTIPANVTSIENRAFSGATALKDVYFLGNAPEEVGDDVFSEIADAAKAHISATATGFGNETTWEGLVVERAPASYAVNYNTGSGSSVAAGTFSAGGSIQAAPVSTRTGYTLVGWSTTPTGAVVTFPYTPAVNADVTLHAIWAAVAVKPSYVSGAKLTGTAKVGKALTLTKGTWKGTATISYTYQWYVCKAVSSKVLTTGKVAPKCTAIKNAKSTSFKLTTKEKAGYLAVLVTGTNRTGKAVIFTSTSGKVS